MSRIVIVGSGAIGPRVARHLLDQGYDVTSVSRRGTTVNGAQSVALDASDVDGLTRVTAGAQGLVNCANPPYHRWPVDWPPLASSLLRTAESTGAVLVTLSNLYPYGRVSAPMTPSTPESADYAKAQVRARMWHEALAAHEAGRVRAAEVRASDFIGPDAQGVFGLRVVPRLLQGRGVRVLGRLDQPHSWSYVDDVARTLAHCVTRPEAWVRLWHAPTNEPRTQRQVVDDLCVAAGVPRVAARAYSTTTLRMVGMFDPLVRELPLTLYQFQAPFVIDDTLTRRDLGLEPTPWSEVIAATVAAYRH